MKTICLSLSLLLLLLAAPSYAAPLRMDVNERTGVANPPGGTGPSPTQAGWMGMTLSGITNVATDFGTLDFSFVAVNGNSAGLDDRDRGQLDSGAHPSSDLLRDFAFVTQTSTNVNGPATLDLVIEGLGQGIYTFTGYFHDNTVAQHTLDLLVSVDGGANFSSAVTGAPVSTTTTPATVGTANFGFSANGVDPVHVRMIGTGGTNTGLTTEVALLNGFEIDGTLVPEPASIALIGVGSILLGLYSRSRRS